MDIKQLINNIPWEDGTAIRILWLKANGKSRSELAETIKSLDGHIILPIILRNNLFLTSNALMADLATLISANEREFKELNRLEFTHISVVIISNEPLLIPQASSPVFLPEWFPILGGKEIFVKISDVFDTAELSPLNSEGARIEQIASLLFEAETLLVSRLKYLIPHQEGKVRGLIDTLRSDDESSGGSTVSHIQKYEGHLAGVSVARAYRPGAKSKSSLLSKLIYQAIKNSPDATAAFSKKLASSLSITEMQKLKPSLFSVMLRPSIALTPAEANCHAGILAFYQAYQLMNAAAHASEYPSYPASLVLANAKDLARFLIDFRCALEEMFESQEQFED